jgi:AraC family transcriptional regulator, regulatory protein of adaptative response / methylated-DNA-[protein]-cysteine methyltransferase
MLLVKERSSKTRRAAKPTSIRFTLADSPLGRMLLAATGKGICAVRFGEDDENLEEDLRTEHATADIERDDASLGPWVDVIVEHLEGRQPALDLPVDVPGTAFQKAVWNELRRIPYGSTKSYGEVARAIGRPKAVRAVGQACACNPVAIVVPCHRVLRGHGQLGGFYWGLERKKFLLEMESKEGGQR